MKKLGKKWLLLISIPALVAFLVFFIFSLFDRPTESFQQDNITFDNMTQNRTPPFFPREDYRQIPMYRLILSPILLIIAIIPISYYFISRSLEEKLEDNLKLISKLFNRKAPDSKTKTNKYSDVNIILKFLNPIERKILERLIENKGKVLQAEINRMEGMTKLKTHRAVKEMERKGIIRREAFGKTHNIILSNEIKDILIK